MKRKPLGIFRSMNELEGRHLGRIPFVHDLSTDYTFGDITVALRKPRMRHRIEGSAMRTEERVAFRDWPCKRHIGLPPYQEPVCAPKNINSSGTRGEHFAASGFGVKR